MVSHAGSAAKILCLIMVPSRILVHSSQMRYHISGYERGGASDADL